jgi:hypothetical protein
MIYNKNEGNMFFRNVGNYRLHGAHLKYRSLYQVISAFGSLRRVDVGSVADVSHGSSMCL